MRVFSYSLSLSFSGSYSYTITERKKINGEKVEKVRSISKREYEVSDISTMGIIIIHSFMPYVDTV